MKVNDFIDIDTLTYKWDFIWSVPEFVRLKDCKQNLRWHSEGNVDKHVIKVCENMITILKSHYSFKSVEAKTVLMIAALFHDIGKGTTTFFKEKDQNWHSYGHEIESERITREMLSDEDPFLIDSVCKLVRYHMEPMDIKKSKNKIQKLFELAVKVYGGATNQFLSVSKSYCSNLSMLLILKLADIMGSEPSDIKSRDEDILFIDKLMRFAETASISETFPHVYKELINIDNLLDK